MLHRLTLGDAKVNHVIGRLAGLTFVVDVLWQEGAMGTEYWGGIVTLLIGWCLEELGDRLRSRREERKPFARATADLLEMRHRFLSVRTALGEIKKHLQFSPDAESALRAYVDALLPQADDLQQRYNEAVSLVAGIDPISSPRTRPLAMPRTTALERSVSSTSVIDTPCLPISFSTTPSFQMISVIRICQPGKSLCRTPWPTGP